MKFLCGSCRTKYQISDEKVRGKVLTIRCKKCGSKVLVKESLAKQGGTIIAPTVDEAQAEGAQRSAAAGAGGVTSRAAMAATLASAFDVAMRSDADDMPTSIGPAPSKEEDAGVEWYIAIDGNQIGPFAYAEVVRRIRAKEVAGKHYVWHDGFDAWKRIRDVQDLSMYLPAEKKKPPPPPPTPVPPPADEDNKVVDIAVKRAERERKASQAKAPAQEPVSAAEVVSPQSEPDSPTIAAEGISDGRAQQLDRVLDEALGIPDDEGSKPLYPPPAAALNEDASALRGVVGIESSVLGADAFSEGDNQHDHIPENLFDQVPRASEQELVSRESTKFFVRAAGMEQRRSRQRMALLAGFAATASVLGFFGMWAMGVIQISLPIIGNPFLNANKGQEEQVVAGELSEKERARLAALENGSNGSGRVVDKAPKGGGGGGGGGNRPRGARAAIAAPGGDYITDEPQQQDNGRRGDDPGATIGIDGVGTTGALSAPVGDVQLPQAKVDGLQPAETGKLDQAMIREVVNQRKSSVTICYQRELKGNQDLRGKLEFLVTVMPSGEVSRANVETAAFKGTALAVCIADKIKAWRFPAFQGEPQNVFVPFVLQGGSSF